MTNETFTSKDGEVAIVKSDKTRLNIDIKSDIKSLNIWFTSSLTKFKKYSSSGLKFSSKWLKVKPTTFWNLIETYAKTLYMHKTQKYADHISVNLSNKHSQNSYALFIQLFIQKLTIQLGSSNDTIYFNKDVGFYSPYYKETITLKTGDGDDTIYKQEVYKRKNPSFHYFRYFFSGENGKDKFNIHTYGINFLNGGKDNDEYDIYIRETNKLYADMVYTINTLFLVSEKTFNTFYSTINSLRKATVKYIIKSDRNPPYINYTGLTFISDYSHENNQLTINIIGGGLTSDNSSASDVFISTSNHLHKKTAEKISSKFFVILKIHTNYVIFYPQTMTREIKIYPYEGAKSITLSLGKATLKSKEKTLYEFNKLPENFNYRKYRVQLGRHAKYKSIASFKKVAGKANSYDISDYIKQ